MNLCTFLKKDFRIEIRDRSHLTSILTLSLMVAVMLTLGVHLAIIPHNSLARILPGFVWISFVLIQTMTIQRSFASEFELGAIESITALPSKNVGAFYYSKCIINTGIGIAAFAFFNGCLYFLLPSGITHTATYTTPAFVVFFLAITAYASLATLLVPISLASSLKDILLALLLVPLSSPIFFAALEVSISGAIGIPLQWDSAWLSLLVLICAIYLPLGSLLFHHTLRQ